MHFAIHSDINKYKTKIDLSGYINIHTFKNNHMNFHDRGSVEVYDYKNSL